MTASPHAKNRCRMLQPASGSPRHRAKELRAIWRPDHVQLADLVLELGNSRTPIPGHLLVLAQRAIETSARRSENANVSYSAHSPNERQADHVRCRGLQRMAMDKTPTSLARHVHKASWALRNLRLAQSSIWLVELVSHDLNFLLSVRKHLIDARTFSAPGTVHARVPQGSWSRCFERR